MIIRTRLFPKCRFAAITLFGVIVTRSDIFLSPDMINHEHIHCRQQLEWLYLPFYIIYIVEWLYHYIKLRSWMKAYHAISFEREAYSNQSDLTYLTHRRPYANFRRSHD